MQVILWKEMARFSTNFPKFITWPPVYSPSYKIYTFIFLAAAYIYQDNSMATKSPEKAKVIRTYQTKLEKLNQVIFSAKKWSVTSWKHFLFYICNFIAVLGKWKQLLTLNRNITHVIFIELKMFFEIEHFLIIQAFHNMTPVWPPKTWVVLFCRSFIVFFLYNCI